MRDRFAAKTWTYWAQLLLCGGIGLFGLVVGVAFWTGFLTDAYGEARPATGPPLVTVSSCLLAVAVMAAANIASRAAPVIRCFRQGIECRLTGATSLDAVPMVPALFRTAWALLSLQGFRSTRYRIAWDAFQFAEVVGLPLAYVLRLYGPTVDLTNETVTPGLELAQTEFIDDPRLIADVLNHLAQDFYARQRLPEWTRPALDLA